MQSVPVEMELWECTSTQQEGALVCEKENTVKLGVPFYEG